jgi:hypothetical protein
MPSSASSASGSAPPMSDVTSPSLASLCDNAALDVSPPVHEILPRPRFRAAASPLPAARGPCVDDRDAASDDRRRRRPRRRATRLPRAAAFYRVETRRAASGARRDARDGGAVVRSAMAFFERKSDRAAGGAADASPTVRAAAGQIVFDEFPAEPCSATGAAEAAYWDEDARFLSSDDDGGDDGGEAGRFASGRHSSTTITYSRSGSGCIADDVDDGSAPPARYHSASGLPSDLPSGRPPTCRAEASFTRTAAVGSAARSDPAADRGHSSLRAFLATRRALSTLRERRAGGGGAGAATTADDPAPSVFVTQSTGAPGAMARRYKSYHAAPEYDVGFGDGQGHDFVLRSRSHFPQIVRRKGPEWAERTASHHASVKRLSSGQNDGGHGFAHFRRKLGRRRRRAGS